MSRTSVVVADRHPLLLRGLSAVLGAESGFDIVATCSDAASCIEAIRTLAPDIALLDPTIPELVALKNSFGAAAGSRTRLVLYVPAEDRDLVLSDAFDGCSVILKEASADALVQSLRQIANGVRIVPPSSTDQIAPAAQASNSENALTVLTDRERQIIRLVSEGLSNKEIGRRLNIADGTIKVHLHHIFQKLEISNRTALAALAISQSDWGTPVKSTESE
ncbi:response regulator transcription factor [Bradyrhizobium sp. CIAT3101]|uniref:LuxR C-terminal-related transcriptional regulator n=1 Tax=Bradyrhizobium sp. CIAT3101 TaxID=439387 RepID=UPI0021154095|nr:response regulator transcription factor [Bradyrhizobium sp. CIAT3101]WFU78286.1 response regulator transcription factor [Bradyrhizobium sp. CIAT3101]